jgi:hypothetical protein
MRSGKLCPQKGPIMTESYQDKMQVTPSLYIWRKPLLMGGPRIMPPAPSNQENLSRISAPKKQKIKIPYRLFCVVLKVSS